MAYWIHEAEQGEASGYLGPDKSEEFLSRILNKLDVPPED